MEYGPLKIDLNISSIAAVTKGHINLTATQNFNSPATARNRYCFIAVEPYVSRLSVVIYWTLGSSSCKPRLCGVPHLLGIPRPGIGEHVPYQSFR